jgi:hypothetical protein
MSDIIENVIEKLRDDESYYGEVGRQYMSNSDIKVLLDNPAMFGVPTPDNPVFAKGRLFHQLILEPEKAANVAGGDTWVGAEDAWQLRLLRSHP